jgi:hypothetical protein
MCFRPFLGTSVIRQFHMRNYVCLLIVVRRSQSSRRSEYMPTFLGFGVLIYSMHIIARAMHAYDRQFVVDWDIVSSLHSTTEAALGDMVEMFRWTRSHL